MLIILLYLFVCIYKGTHCNDVIVSLCLSFRGSIDCVQLINEEHMITGADDG